MAAKIENTLTPAHEYYKNRIEQLCNDILASMDKLDEWNTRTRIGYDVDEIDRLLTTIDRVSGRDCTPKYPYSQPYIPYCPYQPSYLSESEEKDI